MSAAANPVQKQLARLDLLLDTLESAEPGTAAVARDAMAALLEAHRAGLTRLLTLMQMSASGDALLAACAHDDSISSLLLLHDLHPVDRETRIREALARLQPHLGQEGARLHYLGAKEQTVWLRIEGDLADPVARALPLLVEAAISAVALDVAIIEILGPHDPDPSGVLVSLPLVTADTGR